MDNVYLVVLGLFGLFLVVKVIQHSSAKKANEDAPIADPDPKNDKR